jgi:hypothetical protein
MCSFLISVIISGKGRLLRGEKGEELRSRCRNRTLAGKGMSESGYLM